MFGYVENVDAEVLAIGKDNRSERKTPASPEPQIPANIGFMCFLKGFDSLGIGFMCFGYKILCSFKV